MFINVVKVADILTVSLLCHKKNRILIKKITEILNIIERVLQSMIVKHLITTSDDTDFMFKLD